MCLDILEGLSLIDVMATDNLSHVFKIKWYVNHLNCSCMRHAPPFYEVVCMNSVSKKES